MQTSKLTILSMLLATLSMLMLGACSDAIDPVVQDSVESAGGKFLSISITAGALQNADAPKASRVVKPNLEGSTGTTAQEGTSTPPNGGEEGDGQEKGNANEFAVERVSVLLYQAPSGVTIPENGVINLDKAITDQIKVKVFCYNTYGYVSGPIGGTGKIIYTTGSQELPDDFKTGDYRFLIVANRELTSLDGGTLSEVRDYVYNSEPFDYGLKADGKTIDYEPSTYSNFAMSSVKEHRIVIGKGAGHVGDGSQDNPYTPVFDEGSRYVEVERLAARIDFAQEEKTENGIDLCKWNSTDQCYDYAVIDQSGNQIATFKLYYIFPFNMTRQGYVFKHTTQGKDLNTCNYLGRETDNTVVDGGWIKHYATNYVLDPMTKIKGQAHVSYGHYYVPQLYQPVLANYAKILLERCKVKSPDKMHTDQSNTGRKYYTVCYSAENTMSIAAQQSVAPPIAHYAAGLRFFGKYVEEGKDPKDASYIALDWFLRHSAPDGKAELTRPMTYGVVRNNIYRVYIKRIGKQNGQVDLNVNVRNVPWAVYTHSDIVM